MLCPVTSHSCLKENELPSTACEQPVKRCGLVPSVAVHGVLSLDKPTWKLAVLSFFHQLSFAGEGGQMWVCVIVEYCYSPSMVLACFKIASSCRYAETEYSNKLEWWIWKVAKCLLVYQDFKSVSVNAPPNVPYFVLGWQLKVFSSHLLAGHYDL